MLDAKNVVTISGGIVSDPEIINDKIAKFRLAVDYAGSEKGGQNNSGYFDIVYYLKEGSDFASKNASFLHSQITNGKLKKGSPIQLIGRLVQERWQQDNSNRSRVVIVAESVSYAASNYSKSNDSSNSSSESSASSSETGSSYSSVPNQF
jgi:single-stranded DNA-binding protein